MKLTNTFLAIAIATTVLISCKKEVTKTVKAQVETQKKLDANGKFETASIKIEGMTCAVGCAKTIEKDLNNSDGIKSATVDFDKKTATIEFDTNVQSTEKVIEIIQKSGDGVSYKASL